MEWLPLGQDSPLIGQTRVNPAGQDGSCLPSPPSGGVGTPGIKNKRSDEFLCSMYINIYNLIASL